MSHHDAPAIVPAPIYLSIPRRFSLSLAGAAGAGVVLSLLSLSIGTGGMRRLMLAYLVAFAFVLSLSLGSLFFVLLQHLMRAGWSVLVRRPAEILGLNLLTVAVLFLPILLSVFSGTGSLYPWAQTDPPQQIEEAAPSAQFTPVAHSEGHATHPPHGPTDHLYVHQTIDSLTRSKQGWLNPTFFSLRGVLFFAAWIAMAWFYYQRSRHQDAAGGDSGTRQMEWWAGACMLLFAMTLTYGAFDLLMSLDPHWYSTIFGVYYFAGCAVSGIAIIMLSLLLIERLGMIPGLLSAEHHRDLGRLLFAFVFFWGYIAFSQYMLLWYANMPETTRWFVVRGASMAEGYTNSWGYLLIFLLVGHFVVPFLVSMSRHVKSNPQAMIGLTGWLLVVHYFDLYWLVMPELGPRFLFGLPEIGTLLFVVSFYLWGASLIATRTSLVPIGDPRLGASQAITDAY